ncbi:hypothetical protein ACWDO0_14445 [Nocardia rhamnosiphila]|uniref:hypothetical protein n=1 Tax=Nocardia rhamnosiphila TaxID=426716 RepID=UPI000B07D458|nr:hypothetical protein [Nocardia rhamnosiphila]
MNISTERSTVPVGRPAGTSLGGASIEPLGFFDFGAAAVLASGRPFFPGIGPLIGALFSTPTPATRYPEDVKE